MDSPGSEKAWRTDGIEPTYALEDPLRPSETIRGWLLGGTFALEAVTSRVLGPACRCLPRQRLRPDRRVATSGRRMGAKHQHC